MKKLALFATFLVFASPALAHTGHGVTAGFEPGLVHPLSGLDHLGAMLATGLAASAFGLRRALAIGGAFLLALAGGFALGLHDLALPAAEAVILASVAIIAGLALLPQRYLPSLLVLAGFAVFHGHAHGLEATGNPSAFAAGFLMTSAFLIATGLSAGRVLRQKTGSIIRG